jgi:hypothetical protein
VAGDSAGQSAAQQRQRWLLNNLQRHAATRPCLWHVRSCVTQSESGLSSAVHFTSMALSRGRLIVPGAPEKLPREVLGTKGGRLAGCQSPEDKI